MRLWSNLALPSAVDLVLSDPVVGDWRRRACRDVSGEVLDVGFGSGRNLPFYGHEVTRVLAIDPSDSGWARARGRIDAFGRPVARVGSDGADIPLADATVDAVVTTWTMCSIPDLSAALGEMRRVLRPGGAVHFVEHSLAPDAGVARAQQRIQPFWGRMSGGCHLDRDIPAALTAAGFKPSRLTTRYVSSVTPTKPWGWFCQGRADA
jgi:ubiquinone/menaquinone biosynthesis C-methylase UbiE